MSKKSWEFELSESFFDKQRFWENISHSLDTLNEISQKFSFPENLFGEYTAVSSYQTILSDICSNNAYEKLIKSMTAMQSVLDDIQLPTSLDMTSTIERTLLNIEASWKIPSIDWDWVAKTLKNYDFESAEAEDVLNDEIRVELNESVQEVLSAEDSQKNIEQQYGEWKEKHPLLADIFLAIIGCILGCIIDLITNCSPAATTKNSKVYESPSSNSNIVTNINVNQNITVINEVPYYYETVFIDSKTGEEIKGFIYKPNVTIHEVEPENIENSNAELK